MTARCYATRLDAAAADLTSQAWSSRRSS